MEELNGVIKRGCINAREGISLRKESGANGIAIREGMNMIVENVFF